MYQERLEARAERDEKEDFMTRYQRLYEQLMEMRMMEVMAEQVERMSARQIPSSSQSCPQQQWSQSQQQWSQWQQSPAYLPYPTLPYPPWQQPAQAPPTPQWQPALPAPSPSVLSSLSVVPPPSFSAQRSSPVGSSEEEELIIEQFFLWKMNKVSRQSTKDKIAEVERLVIAQMWSVDDLKGMADSTSSIYRTAIQLGVPDGMARRFKEDLEVFKPHWRQAKTLSEPGQASASA